MCFVYIGFEIINNVQDMSVYAVVKAIIFPLNATAFLKTVIFYFSAGVKTLFFKKLTRKAKFKNLIRVATLLDKFKVTSEHVLIIGHCLFM